MPTKVTPIVTVAVPPPRGYKRPRGAAEYLGVHISTIWKLVAAGELTTVKLAPRVTVIPVEQLDAFVARRAAAQREAA